MTIYDLQSAARLLFTEVINSEDYQQQFPNLSAEECAAHIECAVQTLTIGDAEELGLL